MADTACAHFASVLAALAGTDTGVVLTTSGGGDHRGRVSTETTSEVAVILLTNWDTLAAEMDGADPATLEYSRAHVRMDQIASVAEIPKPNPALFGGLFKAEAPDRPFGV